MQVSQHDKQIVETMMREFLDISFTQDGEQGDVVDHVQRFKSQFNNQITELLAQSFDYVNENAQEEAEKRGADDPQDVRLALLANMPMVVCSIAADMVLTSLLTQALGGVVAVGQGQLTTDDARELIDELMDDINTKTRDSATKKAEKLLAQAGASMEALRAIKRASETQ